MYTRIAPFAVIVVLFASCTKSTDIVNNTFAHQNETKSFTSCNCSVDSVEYIQGVFNDVKMYFSTTYATPDSSENIIYYTPGVEDQINLIRQNKDLSMSCQLYFINSNVYQQILPYVVPRPNLAYCEHAELHLLDYSQRWASQCPGCSTDNADYFSNTTNNNFSVTITDTTNGYLKGTFEGSTATGTGLNMNVTNGSFNIHTYKVINVKG
ncbi:MAG: hypothetical protein M3R72_07830 [Bacteroidota bacterium]|nr:hypothetical protein [Bacteroidota bacterium]